MQLHTVESGGDTAFGCGAEAFHQPADFRDGQFARRGAGGPAGLGEGEAAVVYDGRGHRLGAARLQEAIGLAPRMIELQKDFAALGMNRIGHELPASDLAVVIQTRRTEVAITIGCGDSRFADQQATGGGTLGVVLGHQLARDGARLGTHTGKWRQNDAMGNPVWAYLDVRMQFGHDNDTCQWWDGRNVGVKFAEKNIPRCRTFRMFFP
ncbi:hypothetical protein D3C86_1180840 [compost metagenome]